MCELQLIKKFDGKKLSENDLKQFSTMLELGADNNSDAWGFFDGKTIEKSSGKFTLSDEVKNIQSKKTNIIFGHNRYATKGDKNNNINNHPFETDKWVVVHNGMISNDEYLKKAFKLTYDTVTDSYIVVALLEFFVDKGYSPIDAIKLTASHLGGSFSIIAYFKPEKRTFYFKEEATKFTFGLLRNSEGDLLLGSTDKENFDYIFLNNVRGFRIMDGTMYLKTPNAGHIMEILDDRIKFVDSFDTKNYGNHRKVYWSDELNTIAFRDTADYSDYNKSQKTSSNTDKFDDDADWELREGKWFRKSTNLPLQSSNVVTNDDDKSFDTEDRRSVLKTIASDIIEFIKGVSPSNVVSTEKIIAKKNKGIIVYLDAFTTQEYNQIIDGLKEIGYPVSISTRKSKCAEVKFSLSNIGVPDDDEVVELSDGEIQKSLDDLANDSILEDNYSEDGGYIGNMRGHMY